MPILYDRTGPEASKQLIKTLDGCIDSRRAGPNRLMPAHIKHKVINM